MSTYNICFHVELRKMLIVLHLFEAMIIHVYANSLFVCVHIVCVE